MSAAQSKSAEPSMEEILASIRRIIADEPVKPAAASAAPAPAAPAAVEDDEIMELRPKPKAVQPEIVPEDAMDDLAFGDPPASAPKGQDDIDALMAAAEEEAAPPPPPVVMAAPPAAAPAPVSSPVAAVAAPAPVERLISPDTDRAASSAFASLATTMLSRNARTLDDLVQDMMRPMIKTWLDDNLPGIVERLVKAEIERVARGGR
jgi:uncharacterized protein